MKLFTLLAFPFWVSIPCRRWISFFGFLFHIGDICENGAVSLLFIVKNQIFVADKMPRYDDRHGSTRLYVGRLSSRTRSRDLEDLFSRYGR